MTDRLAKGLLVLGALLAAMFAAEIGLSVSTQAQKPKTQTP